MGCVERLRRESRLRSKASHDHPGYRLAATDTARRETSLLPAACLLPVFSLVALLLFLFFSSVRPFLIFFPFEVASRSHDLPTTLFQFSGF